MEIAPDWILTTPRLRLCPATLDDAESLHALWTQPDVRRYLWDDIVIPLDTALAVLRESCETFERAKHGLWNVQTSSNTLAGFVMLRDSDGGVELLYGLAREYWGHGYATEAAQAVLGYAFHTLGFDHIIAGTDPPNTESIRVLERLGFHADGERRFGEKWCRAFSLTREAYKNTAG